MKCYNQAPDKEMHSDLVNILQKLRENRCFDVDKYIEDKINILNSYMSKSKLDACVVAVSGGIDSAIVLGLAMKAASKDGSPIKKVIPMLLPCLNNKGVTNQEDATKRGRDVCETFGLTPQIINMFDIVAQIRTDVEATLGLNTDNWAIGQLVPYTRTPVLYYTTSLLNVAGYRPIILGTTNFSEGGYLGYVGKASDGMVDVQLISDIYKSEVYQVAERLNIPESVMKVTPAGDMYDSRVDEEVFGASYDFVELYQEYLRLSPKQQVNILLNISQDALTQFYLFSENLDNLHNYNAHKYLCGSPAVHLDIYDSKVPGGWNNTPWTP